MRRLILVLSLFIIFGGFFITVLPASAALTGNLIVGGDFSSGDFTGVSSAIPLPSGTWYTSQTASTNDWQISSLAAMMWDNRAGILIQVVNVPDASFGPVEFSFSYNTPNANETAILYGSNIQPTYGSYGTQIGTTISLPDSSGWASRTETFGGGSFSGYDWYTVVFQGTVDANRLYIDNVSLKVSEGTTVPLPAAAWLLGSGLVGLIAIRRKFRKN
jgi:hypothetical protein